MAISRVLLLFALCVLPGLVSARTLGNPFHIQGRVYCDTCRCGFETTATTYIPGATVRIECKYRNTLQLAYSVEGETDTTGTYNILVEDDHEDQICESVLVSSPVNDCKSADPGRNRANVVVTRYNGVVKDKHYANNMGFFKDQPLAGCEELLKQYLNYDQPQ
ncbi:PREDICTED: protein DOWNSTREAM OF FLC-like [Prunus mume]|uniref:Protein DOWNSTREAM OF FLC-like n=1 Tax=Prunus mume TaxID=102107 RepID=A0ABM0PVB2_PRUMU|nr:PREDICTED: protein DOWNSTREAM OF FLC-like [Prunus mume]